MTQKTLLQLKDRLRYGDSNHDKIKTGFIIDLVDSVLQNSVTELTASGAVPDTARIIELNHASVIIAATYNVTPNSLVIIKDTSATGTAAHNVTLSGGTFNGTNTVATLNARDEFLVVWFDSAGRGQVIANVGSVALS